jgi:hypothetical protein
VDRSVEHELTGEPSSAGTAGAVVGLSLLPDPGEYFGFTLWRDAWAVTVAIIAVRCAHLSNGTAWAVLAVVTMWAVLSASLVTAFAAGVMTWLLGTGFVVHRLGDLSFTAGDRVRLGATVVLALGAALVAGSVRSSSMIAGKALQER